MTITIDCISDLHGEFPNLMGGDLLIIAGDCTTDDTVIGWNNFFNWLDKQNYRKKVMIAGNHDNFCKKWATSDDSIHHVLAGKPAVSYLCDSSIDFEGIKIWGSPWTAWFKGVNPKCTAFMIHEAELIDKFNLIPTDVDILITHSPPYGILDSVNPRYPDFKWQNFGSRALRQRLYDESIKPKLHVFGHIHYSYGHIKKMNDYPNTQFVNAAYMNEDYVPINNPVRIELVKILNEVV